MKPTLAEVSEKLVKLGLWQELASVNFAIRPRGTVFPYFCTTVKAEMPGIAARVMLIEGWQTFHDFLRGRVDRAFGVATGPIELQHFEFLALDSGAVHTFRYDTGYAPRPTTEKEAPLLTKLLWEVYGLAMRLESDLQLPMRYAAEQAVFSRQEQSNGKWIDAPLPIVQPQPYGEKVTFPKALATKAADLPFRKDEIVEIDFRLLPGVSTREARPRLVYELSVVDVAAKKDLVRERTSFNPEVGLKGMWETVPVRLMHDFVDLGKVPGQIHCFSPRVFRFLRPLCMELPIKLSLHDRKA